MTPKRVKIRTVREKIREVGSLTDAENLINMMSEYFEKVNPKGYF